MYITASSKIIIVEVNGKMKNLKEWSEKLKTLPAKKKTQYLAIVIVIAAILMIYFSTFEASNKSSGAGKETTLAEQTEADMESRLEEILSKVDGAGNVEVVINYDSSGELIPAMSEEKSTSSDDKSNSSKESSEIATVKSGSDTEAVIIKHIEPEVRGVIVVAEGADNIRVKIELLEAVKVVLDVGADKVQILKMKER